MTDLLRVTCHGCAPSFVSAHQGLRVSLAVGEVTALEERCPHCGAGDLYHLSDYDHGPLVGRITPVRAPRD